MNNIGKKKSEKLAGKYDNQPVYEKPRIEAEERFETFVMACGKESAPPGPDPCFTEPQYS